MDTYRELYYHLFHVNETALRALERSDVSGAVRILSAGQREAGGRPVRLVPVRPLSRRRSRCVRELLRRGAVCYNRAGIFSAAGLPIRRA